MSKINAVLEMLGVEKIPLFQKMLKSVKIVISYVQFCSSAFKIECVHFNRHIVCVSVCCAPAANGMFEPIETLKQ